MAVMNIFAQGTSTSSQAVGENRLHVKQVVIDAAKVYAYAAANGYTASDTILLMSIPANTLLTHLDAQISATLAGVTSTSIGTTAATPTEYVNAQTDTAVGRFTTYASNTPASLTANYRAALFTSAGGVYLKFGALGTTSAGKVSVTAVTVDLNAVDVARARTYTN